MKDTLKLHCGWVYTDLAGSLRLKGKSTMSLQRFVLTLLVVSGSTLAAFGAEATPPLMRTSTYNFAPVGLGSTETLQVNIANLASNPTLASNPAMGSPASCTASVAFLNASGAAIGTATSVTATAGETQSVKLTSTQAGTGTHGEVRVVITLTEAVGVPCSAVYTVETYDSSSGATHLYVTANGPISFLQLLPIAL